jgi:hypothetical protein
MKAAVLISLLCGAAAAQDAPELMAKARAAFLENRSQERYWIWTTTTTRSILDKSGKTLETLPSVTVESPIRSDGRRCNAVVAWGDGVEPYLKNAAAEERCKVEEEAPPVIRMEAVLESGHASVQARTNSEITLAIHPDNQAREARCEGSLEGTIGLDPETYFPKRVDLRVVTDGCAQKVSQFEEHYGGSTVKAAGGYLKGTQIRFEYALQKDKSGSASCDFWIAAHRRAVQPFPKNITGILISGRRFKLSSKGAERQGVTEVSTTATETSAESMLKFDVPK